MTDSDTWSETQLPTAELVMRQGPTPGQSFPLTKPAITIGRRAENDLVIADHEVSGRHASLAWDGSRWTIQDLGSANGTYVHGQRIAAIQVLQDGDIIGLGPGVQLVLHARPPEAGLPPDVERTMGEAMPHTAGPAPVPSADQAEPAAADTGVDADATFVEAVPGTALEPSAEPVEPSLEGSALDAGATFVEAVPESEQVPGADQVEPSIMESAAVGAGATFVEAMPESTQVPRADQVEPSVDAGATIVEVPPESAWLPSADQVAPSVTAPPADAGATLIEPLPGTAGAPSGEPARVSFPVRAEPFPRIPASAETGKRRRLLLPVVVAVFVVGCLLTGALIAFIVWPGEAGVPAVLINSPQKGERVTVGQEIPIDSVAWDEGSVTRVELWIDGQLQETQASSLPQDGSPFPFSAHWQPLSAGTHTLTARAFNAKGGQAQASLTVEAIGPAAGASSQDLDSDGDGVLDDEDGCPQEPGLPEHGGCASPGPNEDADGDGTPDQEERVASPLGVVNLGGAFAADAVLIELQALEFETAQAYHRVFCYSSLAPEDLQRHELESLGGTRWGVPAELGNRLMVVQAGKDLGMQVQCYGQSSPLPVEPPLSLGSFHSQHRPDDWEARRELFAESVGGQAGQWFRLRYRLCAGLCEPSAIAVPILTLRHFPNRTLLAWQWQGDESALDGFWLHVDGNRVDRLPPGQSTQDITKYAPACGETREFRLTAFRGRAFDPNRESRPSNPVTWQGEPCSSTAGVTMDDLLTYSPEPTEE